jgi:hypothetical protein
MFRTFDKYGGYILLFCFVGLPVLVSMLPLIILLLSMFAIVGVALLISEKLEKK